MSLSDLVFPKPLFGTYAQALRAWRPISNRALREGTWKNALAEVEFLSLEERPEDIVTNFPARFEPDGDAWQLCIVHDCIFRHKGPVDVSNAEIRAVHWDGIRYPWFLLSAFCSQGAGFPAGGGVNESKVYAIRVLNILAQMWDTVCLVEQRFRGGLGERGWPVGVQFLVYLLSRLDLPAKWSSIPFLESSEAAGRILKDWLEEGIIPRPEHGGLSGRLQDRL